MPLQKATARYITSTGDIRAGLVGVMNFTGATDGNGQVVVNATIDGTSGAAAMFSTILDVNAACATITANIQDNPFFASYSIASGKNITLQFARGNTVLLGGVTSRVAANDVSVTVSIIGVLN